MTSCTLRRWAGKGSPAIFQKVVPVTQQKGGGAPAGTVPITATPIVGGKEGATQTINVPIAPSPAQKQNQQKK